MPAKGKGSHQDTSWSHFSSLNMEVYINNILRDIAESSTLLELLHAENMSEKKGIAVAINNEVIPRVSWEKQQLSAQDRITIIRATQGG